MGRYFLSDTMRGLISVSVLVASAVAAPQWDGLKSLVKNLSGDDKPGEVNGDYEQVPYEVLEGEAPEQDVHETLQIHRWCEQGEPGDRDDGPSVEQDGRLSGGWKDYQRHVLLYYQRIPIKSSR